MTRESPLEALRALHRAVDRRAADLSARHAARLHCARGCSSCCVDDLRVFEIEAERIRGAHPALLREGTPHPPGACAFLGDAGECRVYEDRPYVCRTQGLPLQWLAEGENGALGLHRDICPLNEEGPPLEDLAEDDCWSIGPCEDALGEIQDRVDGGKRRRVALRALFSGRG